MTFDENVLYKAVVGSGNAEKVGDISERVEL